MSEAVVNRRDTYCIDPSEEVASTDDYAAILQKTLRGIDDFCGKHRVRGGLVLVRPFRVQVSPRAWAIFLLALRSMILGKIRLVVMDPFASSAAAGLSALSVAEPAALFLNQGILVGDLFANNFIILGKLGTPWWQGLGKASQDGDVFSFAESVRETLMQRNQEFLKVELERALAAPDVRLEPGPFFVEEQYYTETFYHVAQAMENPRVRGWAVEWCLSNIEEEVEVLVSASPKITPLIQDLANEIHRYSGKTPVVVLHKDWSSRSITQTFPATKRKTVLITDVICRGIITRRVAETLGFLDISVIVTLVDARTRDDLGEPLPIGYSNARQGGTRHLVPVKSVVWETISPLPDIPLKSERDDEERVYVVDPVVGTPTLYKRRIRPAVTPKEILGPIMQECGGLRLGHLSLNYKHYSVFLEFPRLFAAVEDKVKQWIEEQLPFLVKESEGEALQVWVYSPADGLPWLADFMRELRPGCTITFVTWEQISAPLPPRAESSLVASMVILPAVESGEAARRCIEYASRFSPKKILLLAVVSRMSPYHLNFLSGVSEYRGAKFIASFFLDLPIRAYDSGPGVCPMCTEVSELERLLGAVRRRPASRLEASLARKISVLKPHSVERVRELELPSQVSYNDCRRAYLRSLYEASELDHDAHMELTVTLDSSNLDRFLEVLSLERRSRHFAVPELQRRLGNAFNRLKERALELLRVAEPPVPIGRFVGSFIHLVPVEFVQGAYQLLERFGLAERDVEDICIGLLELGEESPRMTEAVSYLREEGHESAASIITETRDFLRHIWAPDEAALQSGVDALAEFFAGLFRSGFFYDYCRAIGEGSWSEAAKERLVETCEKIVEDWKDRLLANIQMLQKAPFWARFANRQSAFVDLIEQLNSEVIALEQLVKSVFPKPDQDIFLHLWSLVKKIDQSRKDFVPYLDRLFPVASHSAASTLKEVVFSDGSVVAVVREIDWNAPEMFCDVHALNYATYEVEKNWAKYGSPAASFKIRVFESDNFVEIHFEDDIPAELDLSSQGGLRALKEICDTYAGKFDTDRESSGVKSVVLRFRKAPRRAWGSHRIEGDGV